MELKLKSDQTGSVRQLAEQSPDTSRQVVDQCHLMKCQCLSAQSHKADPKRRVIELDDRSEDNIGGSLDETDVVDTQVEAEPHLLLGIV